MSEGSRLQGKQGHCHNCCNSTGYCDIGTGTMNRFALWGLCVRVGGRTCQSESQQPPFARPTQPLASMGRCCSGSVRHILPSSFPTHHPVRAELIEKLLPGAISPVVVFLVPFVHTGFCEERSVPRHLVAVDPQRCPAHVCFTRDRGALHRQGCWREQEENDTA